MKPQRIVFLMSPGPLPFGNAVSRWYYVLLKGLVERGHQVKAFASCTTAAEGREAEGLFPAPQYSLRCYEYPKARNLASKIAALQRPHAYLFNPELRRDLETELSRGYDILHLEALWSGWAAPAHRSRALLNLHYLFQIDRADERPDSIVERARMIRTNQSENRLLRQYPFLCTVSPRLSEYARTINPSAEIHTLPLGMDLTRYSFETGAPPQPVVTLIGSFDWRPSYTAGKRLLDRLWPEIHRRVPQASLQVVGRRALAVFSEYQNQAGISIHQDVPDTVPYFREASVLLYAPGHGSGMKVKVLESFALGLPVVTTAEGVEGIPAVDGMHAGVCEDDAGLIERTVALLKDRIAGERQARAARALVEQQCMPDAVLDKLEGIYGRLLARQHKESVA